MYSSLNQRTINHALFRPGVEVGDHGDDETVDDPFKQIQTKQEYGENDMNGVETIDEQNHNEPQGVSLPDNIPILRKSNRLLKLSTAGATMKGVPHVTNLENKLWEMKETHEHRNDHAHILDDKVMIASDVEVNNILGIVEDDP